MEYNEEEFLLLLRLDQNLKELGKSLFLENKEKSYKLNSYYALVENQIYWERRLDYLNLIKSLLNNILNYDQFCLKLGKINKEVCSKIDSVITEIKNKSQISNSLDFKYNPMSSHFGDLVDQIISLSDEFEDGLISEAEFYDYLTKELVVKIES